MIFFNKKKQTGWFAIAKSEHGTCVAHVVTKPGEKPLVTMAEQVDIVLNDAASTKAFATKYNLAQRQCTLLLTRGEYQLLQTESPSVPVEEIKQAVGWKLKDMMDYPVEQATIDIIRIPADPTNDKRQTHLLAVTASNTVIGGYIEQFLTNNKTGLAAIDIRELAQRNIAAYLEQENRGLAILTINGSEGLLTFTAGGELYKARTIDIFPKQMQSEDSGVKSNAYERISLDIQRSLDNFERQVPYININRLLLGPFDGREDFYDYLKTALYIQVDRFNIADVVNLAPGVDLGDLTMQASLLPAISAALREEKPA